MSKMSFEKTKIGSFFARKGFYAALALCLVAIGASGWFAVDGLLPAGPDTADAGSVVSEAEPPASSPGILNADNPVSGVPAPSQSEPADAPPESDPEPPAASDAPEPEPESQPEELPTGAQPSETPQATFFVLPVSGEITKPYSDDTLQYSETCRDWRLHPGVDIAGAMGGRVNASGSGIVSEVYDDPLWGSTAVIDHGNGLCSYYCGLQNVKVEKGDVVEANQSIGQIGTAPCECVEQVHLHFAMKRDGVWVSPLKILEMIPEASSEE